MNWVGGARSRIKAKSEHKKQREFFKKKKLEEAQKAENRNAFAIPALSQDLLTFHFLQRNSQKMHQSAKPVRIIKQDLDKIVKTSGSSIKIPQTLFYPAISKNNHAISYNAQSNTESNTVDLDLLLNNKEYQEDGNPYSSAPPSAKRKSLQFSNVKEIYENFERKYELDIPKVNYERNDVRPNFIENIQFCETLPHAVTAEFSTKYDTEESDIDTEFKQYINREKMYGTIENNFQESDGSGSSWRNEGNNNFDNTRGMSSKYRLKKQYQILKNINSMLNKDEICVSSVKSKLTFSEKSKCSFLSTPYAIHGNNAQSPYNVKQAQNYSDIYSLRGNVLEPSEFSDSSESKDEFYFDPKFNVNSSADSSSSSSTNTPIIPHDKEIYKHFRKECVKNFDISPETFKRIKHSLKGTEHIGNANAVINHKCKIRISDKTTLKSQRSREEKVSGSSNAETPERNIHSHLKYNAYIKNPSVHSNERQNARYLEDMLKTYSPNIINTEHFKQNRKIASPHLSSNVNDSEVNNISLRCGENTHSISVTESTANYSLQDNIRNGIYETVDSRSNCFDNSRSEHLDESVSKHNRLNTTTDVATSPFIFPKSPVEHKVSIYSRNNSYGTFDCSPVVQEVQSTNLKDMKGSTKINPDDNMECYFPSNDNSATETLPLLVQETPLPHTVSNECIQTEHSRSEQTEIYSMTSMNNLPATLPNTPSSFSRFDETKESGLQNSNNFVKELNSAFNKVSDEQSSVSFNAVSKQTNPSNKLQNAESLHRNFNSVEAFFQLQGFEKLNGETFKENNVALSNAKVLETNLEKVNFNVIIEQDRSIVGASISPSQQKLEGKIINVDEVTNTNSQLYDLLEGMQNGPQDVIYNSFLKALEHSEETFAIKNEVCKTAYKSDCYETTFDHNTPNLFTYPNSKVNCENKSSFTTSLQSSFRTSTPSEADCTEVSSNTSPNSLSLNECSTLGSESFIQNKIEDAQEKYRKTFLIENKKHDYQSSKRICLDKSIQANVQVNSVCCQTYYYTLKDAEVQTDYEH
ncbi:uncharacterized protein LOC118184558 [Stegodyphus dumicola]|uniref:uncharacterized protein LOC118184558 n=1 Tax=Stegodyphus dumicola TaxID=202533 RepID=UPI0015B118B1|nr:uncharacterized protein LOC118184558 [Stegodyphus dumicola]